MEKDSKIYVAGGQSLIGSAILRQLAQEGYTNYISEQEENVDLTNGIQVERFFSDNRPEYVFLAAGHSGGIAANQKFPADLMLNNLLVAAHIIKNAHVFGVKKLLYLASSCSYPKFAEQPMRVESLMTGPLEPTNEAYAVAKITGMKLCQAYYSQYGCNFISGIPANSFGPEDDFESESSHVISALIRRMHEAKVADAESVDIWGTGTPRREFIYVDDLASACLFIMQNYDDIEPINIGSGFNISIKELAEVIKEIVGYQGQLKFDTSKPDGMPLKGLDSGKLSDLGWQPQTSFQSALTMTYEAYLSRIS